jgi:hypothetical protein
MAGFLAWWYYKKWMRIKIARENEYDEKYKEISDGIKFCKVNPDTYKYLFSELEKLGKLKYKNREKTKVLKDNFYWKYRSEDTRRINEFRKVI